MTVLEFVRNAHPVISVALAVGGTISVGGGLMGCIMAGDDANKRSTRIMGAALICLGVNFIFGSSILINNLVKSQSFGLAKNSILFSAICAAVSPIFLPLVTYPEIAGVCAIAASAAAFYAGS